MAADRAPAQLARQLADLQRGVRAAGAVRGQAAAAGDVEIQGAAPAGEQLAGVELVGACFGLPGQVRPQRQRAVRLQAALCLFQLQRVQGDQLRGAVEVQRQLRELARRPDVDVAFGVVRVGAAAGLERAAAGQCLAGQVRRQQQVVPADVQCGAEWLGTELHDAAGLHAALDLRRTQLELLQGQRGEVVAEARAQRLQQQPVVVEIEPAVEGAAVAVAMALHGDRQRLQRTVAEQRRRVEARRVELPGPGVFAGRDQVHLQSGHGRRGEPEVELRPLAVAARIEAAGVAGAADLPGEGGLAVALVTRAERQLAIEVGVAVGRQQHQPAQFDAVVGPAAGQVEPMGGEQRLAVLRQLQRAHVHAVEDQLDRRLQREAAGAGGVVRCGPGQGHLDAIDVQREHMQASGQQRPEAQIQMRLRHDRHGALAVVVADAGQVERTEQAALRLLHLQRAVGGRLRPRQRKAQTGTGAEQPP